MIRTSRDAAGEGRRFALWSAALVTVLVIMCALMAGSALARGPQVRAVSGDTTDAVAQRDVTIIFRTDQPLDAASAQGVTLEPAAPMDVEVAGATVRVRFTQTLDFATDYRLVIPSLRGQATGTVSSASYDFTTPLLTMTTLERGGVFGRDEGEDTIVRHDLSRGSNVDVLTAPRIQEYAEAGGDVVAAVIDRDGSTSLRMARADGTTSTLSLPGRGDVRLLRESLDAGRIGYVFTGVSDDGTRQYTSTLLLADPADPSAPPRTVSGLDGSPLQTDAWQFVPGSGYLVAQTADRSLLLVDATGAAPPQVLGQLGDLLSFLPGTTSVVVGGVGGLSILDLTTGSVRDIEGTRTANSAPGTGRLVLSPDTLASWSAREVAIGPVGGTPSVTARAKTGTRVEEVCASPSGRYLAVGIVPDDAVIDGYPARADWVGRESEIVEVATGATVGHVAGTRPSWCG